MRITFDQAAGQTVDWICVLIKIFSKHQKNKHTFQIFSVKSAVWEKSKSRSTWETQRPFTKRNRYLRFPPTPQQTCFSSFSSFYRATCNVTFIAAIADLRDCELLHSFRIIFFSLKKMFDKFHNSTETCFEKEEFKYYFKFRFIFFYSRPSMIVRLRRQTWKFSHSLHVFNRMIYTRKVDILW